LSEAFNIDALLKAADLGLRLVIAGSAADGVRENPYFRSLARRFKATLIDQGLGHLGMRMAQALLPFAAEGALLIGTDTPSLPVTALRRSASLIRRNHVVLGPSLDGGYYLVGIRGQLPDIFRGIRWGGPQVLRQSIARLVKSGIRPALAPTWYDVDRWSDLMLLAEHLRRIARYQALPCPETAKVLMRLGLLPGCR
jgi:glycosyltransferase A (GT-A) superfamily protein (DUF2064 family)